MSRSLVTTKLNSKYTAGGSGGVSGISGSGTANQLTYFTGSTSIGSLTTVTYPTLTELSYVKGVTSAIQTQLNSKVGSIGTLDNQTKSANGLVITGSNIYAQTADATNPGMVSTVAQTFAGSKSFIDPKPVIYYNSSSNLTNQSVEDYVLKVNSTIDFAQGQNVYFTLDGNTVGANNLIKVLPTSTREVWILEMNYVLTIVTKKPGALNNSVGDSYTARTSVSYSYNVKTLNGFAFGGWAGYMVNAATYYNNVNPGTSLNLFYFDGTSTGYIPIFGSGYWDNVNKGYVPMVTLRPDPSITALVNLSGICTVRLTRNCI